MTAPCHGCHGTGNEPSGTTYAAWWTARKAERKANPDA